MNKYERNHASPSTALRTGLRDLANDIISLGELQAELLQVDLRDWFRRCLLSTLLLAGTAAILAVSSVPLALLGAAYAIAQFGGLSLAASLLIVAGVGVVVAGLCALAAWRSLCSHRGSFSRFRVELAKNVSWLKEVLSNPTAAPEVKT